MYVALTTAVKTGPNNVSLEWSTEHVRGEGEEPTEEGGNRGAGPLEAGGRGGLGHFTFLELFYCGLVPFFAREVWPVILHAHGPKGFHTLCRNTFYHSTSFLVPADGHSTPHKLPTATRGQLVHLLPVWHLRLGTCSHDSHSLASLPMGYLGATTSGCTCTVMLQSLCYIHVHTCTCTCTHTYEAYVH